VEIPVNLSKQFLEPGGRLDQPEWAMPTPATDAGSTLPTEEAARLFGRN
jgi:hypothetical protein